MFVRHQHSHLLIQRAGGDGIDQLGLQGEATGDAFEFGFAEEAVVEASAAAQAVTKRVESEAGDDDEVDIADGDGLM